MKKGVLIGVLLIFTIVSSTFADLQTGTSGEIGLNLIPEVPINYSTVNVNNSQFLQGYTPTTLGVLFNGTLNSIAWNRLGTNVFLANINDRVGVGTVNPVQKFDVAGSDNFNPIVLAVSNYVDATSNVALDLLETNSGGAKEFGTAQVYGFRLEYDGFDNKLYLKSGDQTTIDTRLTVMRANGNVGIGTSSPSEKLNVSGNIGVTGNVTASYFFGDASKLTNLPSTTDGSANSSSWNRSGTNVYLANIGDNVGIGTTSPRASLEISGGGNALYIVNGTDTRIVIGDTTGASDYGELRWDTTGNYLGLDADSTRALVLQEDGGKVGIGTTGPTRQLTVSEATNTYMSFLPQGTHNEYVIGSDSYGFVIYDDTNNEYRATFSKTDNAGLSIGTGYYANAAPSNGMIIEGNVGIGTTAPTHKLNVVGDLNVTNDIYSNNYQVLSYKREVVGNNVTMTAVI